jgi:hypothetical protein
MIWKTPNGRAFAAAVHSSLSRGKNAVVVLPRPLIGQPFVKAVSGMLVAGGHRPPRVFDLSRAEPHETSDLAAILRSAWDWKDEHPAPDFSLRPSPADLFRILAADGTLRFLALTCPEELPPAARETVASGAADWARLSAPTGGAPPVGLRLLLAVTPSLKDVRPGPALAKHVFWGRIRHEDLEWAFRRLASPSANGTVKYRAEYMFLKSVCLALCWEDLDLMRKLVAEKPTSLEAIEKALAGHPLRKVAERKKWLTPLSAMARHPLLNSGLPPAEPSGRLQEEQWSEGLMAASGGAAWRHPVLLDREGIERAVASSQREVLMPVVDHVHRMLISAVEAVHGKAIWFRQFRKAGPRDDSLTEIAHLAAYISKHVGFHGPLNYSTKGLLMNCAHAWRDIRNTTAHNNMASFDEVMEAVKAYDAFREFFDELTGAGR